MKAGGKSTTPPLFKLKLGIMSRSASLVIMQVALFAAFGRRGEGMEKKVFMFICYALEFELTR
jgi:hypothetical protein